MVAGMHKSKSLRKVYVKAPGNTVKVHYRTRKPSKAVCAKYGTPLQGVARANPTKMQNLPKTAKRPQRPFGGVLSSKATREVMKAKARQL